MFCGVRRREGMTTEKGLGIEDRPRLVGAANSYRHGIYPGAEHGRALKSEWGQRPTRTAFRRRTCAASTLGLNCPVGERTKQDVGQAPQAGQGQWPQGTPNGVTVSYPPDDFERRKRCAGLGHTAWGCSHPHTDGETPKRVWKPRFCHFGYGLRQSSTLTFSYKCLSLCSYCIPQLTPLQMDFYMSATFLDYVNMNCQQNQRLIFAKQLALVIAPALKPSWTPMPGLTP